MWLAGCELSRVGMASLAPESGIGDVDGARDLGRDRSDADPAPRDTGPRSDASPFDASTALDGAMPDARVRDASRTDAAPPDGGPAPDARPAGDAATGVCPPPDPPTDATPLVRYTFAPGLLGGLVPDESIFGCFPLSPFEEGDDTIEVAAGRVTFAGGHLELGLDPSQSLARLLTRARLGFSVEVWAGATVTDQNGPRRIVTLSTDTGRRAFTIAHGELSSGSTEGRDVIARFRSTATNENGDDGDGEIASASEVFDDTDAVHHIVLVWAPPLTLLYVDGRERDRFDHGAGATLGWGVTDRFLLGNELTRDRRWSGRILALSIFTVPLGSAEIDARFRAGPE